MAPSLEGFESLEETPSSKMVNLTFWHFKTASLTFLPKSQLAKFSSALSV
jgi:hypothetical protein